MKFYSTEIHHISTYAISERNHAWPCFGYSARLTERINIKLCGTTAEPIISDKRFNLFNRVKSVYK